MDGRGSVFESASSQTPAIVRFSWPKLHCETAFNRHTLYLPRTVRGTHTLGPHECTREYEMPCHLITVSVYPFVSGMRVQVRSSSGEYVGTTVRFRFRLQFAVVCLTLNPPTPLHPLTCAEHTAWSHGWINRNGNPRCRRGYCSRPVINSWNVLSLVASVYAFALISRTRWNVGGSITVHCVRLFR